MSSICPSVVLSSVLSSFSAILAVRMSRWVTLVAHDAPEARNAMVG